MTTAVHRNFFCWLRPILFLSAALLLPANRALSAPHVFVLAPQFSNTLGFQLLEISAKDRKKIVDLNGNVLFGSDDSSLALVDQNTNGSRLSMVNRRTGKISSTTMLPDVKLIHRLRPIADEISVQPKNSTVFFPIINVTDGAHVELMAVNWRTGKARRFPPEHAEPLQFPSLWAAWPGGFAFGFNAVRPGPASSIQNVFHINFYDTAAQKRLLTMDLPDDKGVSSKPQLVFVPKTGVMESHRSGLTQLTGADVATAVTNSPPIPAPDSDTEIFSRVIKKKTCLIWGEDNSATALAGRNMGEITDLVIFDLSARSELLRKPLPATVSALFVPDTAGARIYLLDAKSGQITFLDTSSQAIMPFANTGVPNSPLTTIVDAY